MDFAQWLMETFGLDAATLTADQTTKFQDIYNQAMAEEEDGTDAALADDEPEPARTTARARSSRETQELIDRTVQRALQAERKRQARRKTKLNATRNRSRHSGAASGEGDDEPQVMEAALLINLGMQRTRLEAHFNEQILTRASHRDYRGFTMVECGDRLRAKAGIHYKGARNQQAHMQKVAEASSRLKANGFSGFALSSILENASDKILLDAYESVETTWQDIAAVRSLNDFKVHSQYALDATNVFKKVGPQGELPQLGFSDRKYSLQAETYGVRFKLDFQSWRNDDLGSFTNRIGQVGLLGGATVEQVVWLLIMSGINSVNLFHTDNKNYLANSANYLLGMVGMTAAEAAIANQVTAANTPLGVSDFLLAVGTALTSIAGTLYTSSKLNETTTADKGKPEDNPFVNKYKPLKAPYMNNTLLKDNTGTTIAHQDDALWMMFAKQGNNAPVNVGFLDGQQTPRVNVIDSASELIGFEMEAAMHFGVGYGDPKLGFCANPSNA